AARRACSCPRALIGTGPWPEILPLMFSSVCPCRTSITSAMQLPFRDCVGAGAEGPFHSVCQETQRDFLVENQSMIPYHSAKSSRTLAALGRLCLLPSRDASSSCSWLSHSSQPVPGGFPSLRRLAWWCPPPVAPNCKARW